MHGCGPCRRSRQDGGVADQPDYTLYRSRPRSMRERINSSEAPVQQPRRTKERRSGSRRASLLKTLKWIVISAVGWLMLSLVLFCISAQTRSGQGISDAAQAELSGGGLPPVTATTILVLGSDRRPAGSREPGANSSGERSDTIMLLRLGGGHSSKLSIPRDTVVPIPGHGTDKINAAYAYGGAALSIATIKQWTGIEIDHLIEIDLENFPKFIDALGGITVRTPCVISDINGGTANGGVSIRLRAGENNLDGKTALAFARTRHNRCIAAYSDLDRARAQQLILGGVRDRLFEPGAFIRLPWASWQAPQAIRTDMGAAGLLGVMSSIAIGGNPSPQVLKPTGAETLSNGGAGLTVDDSAKQRAIDKFMNG
jgi:LCP family protein required for cell wall assembly